jgi:hypothetical protein
MEQFVIVGLLTGSTDKRFFRKALVIGESRARYILARAQKLPPLVKLKLLGMHLITVWWSSIFAGRTGPFPHHRPTCGIQSSTCPPAVSLLNSS